ncbi:hypothetical protein KY311_00385 [Candidatus Woesearchaeota archaeon]|nr:hypothetical protein [Candidatus Woesearchaeota archaeon]
MKKVILLFAFILVCSIGASAFTVNVQSFKCDSSFYSCEDFPPVGSSLSLPLYERLDFNMNCFQDVLPGYDQYPEFFCDAVVESYKWCPAGFVVTVYPGDGPNPPNEVEQTFVCDDIGNYLHLTWSEPAFYSQVFLIFDKEGEKVHPVSSLTDLFVIGPGFELLYEQIKNIDEGVPEFSTIGIIVAVGIVLLVAVLVRKK